MSHVRQIDEHRAIATVRPQHLFLHVFHVGEHRVSCASPNAPRPRSPPDTTHRDVQANGSISFLLPFARWHANDRRARQSGHSHWPLSQAIGHFTGHTYLSSFVQSRRRSLTRVNVIIGKAEETVDCRSTIPWTSSMVFMYFIPKFTTHMKKSLMWYRMGNAFAIHSVSIHRPIHLFPNPTHIESINTSIFDVHSGVFTKVLSFTRQR